MIRRSTRHPRAVPALLVAATLAVALPACGEPDVVATDRPAIRLTLEEYRIVPQRLSVREGRLKLIARNTGRLAHNVRVQVPPEGPGDRGQVVEGTPTAQPGERVTEKVTLRPGRYRLVCTIQNHDDLGMQGELIVRPR